MQIQPQGHRRCLTCTREQGLSLVLPFPVPLLPWDISEPCPYPLARANKHVWPVCISILPAFLDPINPVKPHTFTCTCNCSLKGKSKGKTLEVLADELLLRRAVANSCVYWKAFILGVWWCCQRFCQEELSVSKVLVVLMVSQCHIKWNGSEQGSTSTRSFSGTERWGSSWRAPEVLQLWPCKIISDKGFRIFPLRSSFCFSV